MSLFGRGRKHFCETVIEGRFGDTLNANMNKASPRPKSAISVILTLLGILTGLTLSLLAVWADYESTSYGFMKRANAPLRGLHCPVFLGKNETGTISIDISNSTDGPLSPSVRMEISTSQDPISNLEFIRLGPGEQTTLQTTVGPENVDLGNFILVNASVYSMYPSPDRENTCGIFVLPVAARGSWILTLGTALSAVLMSAGSFSFYRSSMIGKRSRALLFMVAATILAMVFCFMGWWVQPLFLIIMTVLTFLISLGSLF